MRPFPLPRVDPGDLRRNRAQAGIRTLLVGVLCLVIGLALGVLWQSRRAQRSAANTEAQATGLNMDTPSAGTSAVLPGRIAAVDPAIVAEVKRQIPNFASVSLEAGSRILREAALKDLEASLSRMQSQLKDAERRVTRMAEAKAETEKQAALDDLQRLQAEQARMLRDVTTRSSAQIEVLRQLKESIR